MSKVSDEKVHHLSLRAQRALDRQLKYQETKASRVRGHEGDLIAGMKQASDKVRGILQEVRPIQPQMRVLEVGSGAHGLIFFFGNEASVGVDPLAHSYSSLFPA